MENCIIMCRSLTYAQRAVKLLEREGIRARLAKAPQGVTPEGCSYGVKLGMKNLDRALFYINSAGIRSGKIFRLDELGRGEELTR